ncbi:MAG: hypothetical protein KJ697_00960 [Nanoarchaeota archaeon]|nr:hypothetical protein [Nanoarchaeota archaeon]
MYDNENLGVLINGQGEMAGGITKYNFNSVQNLPENIITDSNIDQMLTREIRDAGIMLDAYKIINQTIKKCEKDSMSERLLLQELRENGNEIIDYDELRKEDMQDIYFALMELENIARCDEVLK